MADYNNGLVIVDVSNPAAPTLKGSYNTAGYSMGVAVAGNYAYVADSDNGLVIIDVSNPAAPTLKGSYNTAGYSHGVAVAGNYAYVADSDNGLVIIDVSNPAAPTLKGSYNTAGNSYGVTVAGNYAYVADFSNGLVIIDVTNPAAPTLKGSYNTAGYSYGVAVAGNYAYVADYNYITNNISHQVYSTVAGNYAYVADYNNSLVIVDVSNPAAPTLKSSYNTAGYSCGVAVAGNYAYVADVSNGLVIVDVTNPILPTLKGRYNTAGYSYGVAVAGNYAYVADGYNGLEILRIVPDTTAPVVTITTPVSGSTVNTATVTVSGTATDNVGVTSVTVNGNYVTLTYGIFSTTVSLASGANIITVVASDAAGNSGTATETVTYTPLETAAPIVTITTPVNGSSVNISTVTVSGTATDNVGVTSVTVNGIAVTLTNGIFSTTVTLANGSNTITVVASDAAGNSGTALISVTYMPEVTAILSISASPSTLIVGTQSNVTFTVTDGTNPVSGANVTFILSNFLTNSNGQVTVPMTMMVAGTLSVTASKSGYNRGSTTLAIVLSKEIVSVGNTNVTPGGTSTVLIQVNGITTDIAAATLELTFDPSVVSVKAVNAADFGTPINNINNAAGTVNISVFSTTAVTTSPVNIASVTLEGAMSAAVGATSPLTLTVNALSDSNGINRNPGASGIINGVVTISNTMKGDVNGDGAVTIVVALFIAQYTVGTRTLTSTQLSVADVNGDGQVTIVDALFIAQATVGLRTL